MTEAPRSVRSEATPPALATLLRCLDLETLDRDLFLGNPGEGEGRLFGGMVAAQSVVAAGRTVEPDRQLHSLHSYFLRPGRHGVPIRMVVDRIRNGRTFTTRRVRAHQAGEAIFSMSASFARPEEGISHQDPMPEAPPPEGLPEWEEIRARILGAPRASGVDTSAVELRMIDAPPMAPGDKSPAYQRSWMRARGALPEEPLVHTALLVFATDRTLLTTAARPHGLPWGQRMSASLDHSVWIHRPVRFDDWLLFVSDSPVAHAARGLIFGALYYADGTRVASVAQEGLIRIRRDPQP
ncbi:MAG: acyl-CoA thioesterase II [Myxococcales bacterium]|nr:acyl-CoA thioesterase II [Myxococcales bacterium]